MLKKWKFVQKCVILFINFFWLGLRAGFRARVASSWALKASWKGVWCRPEWHLDQMAKKWSKMAKFDDFWPKCPFLAYLRGVEFWPNGSKIPRKWSKFRNFKATSREKFPKGHILGKIRWKPVELKRELPRPRPGNRPYWT